MKFVIALNQIPGSELTDAEMEVLSGGCGWKEISEDGNNDSATTEGPENSYSYSTPSRN